MKNNLNLSRLLLIAATILLSCDNNGIDGIFSRAEPTPDVVVAESLNEGRNIFLKWNADPGADSYIIARSIDSAKGIDEFQQIYNGTETNYIDQNIDANLSYVYRLDKLRGNTIFEGKEVTLFSRTRNDPFFDEVVIERLSGDAEVYLEWRLDTGADSYILTKSKETDAGLENFKDIYHGLATSYSDKAISDAMVYVYRLDKMRDGKRIEGEGVTVFSRYTPFPDNIDIDVVGSGDEVRLSWGLDANADKYIIRKQSIDEFGHLTELDPIETEQITYLDNEVAIDMMYFYRLDKIRGGIVYEGVETASYSRIRETPFSDLIVLTKMGDKLSLSWRHDENADLYIITKQSIDEFGNIVELDPIETQQITYMDSDVETDKMYVYRLDKLRGGIIFEGIETTVYSLIRRDPFPDIIEATTVDNKASLSWQPDENADSYIIRKQSIDEFGNIVDLEPIETRQTTYVDSNVETDKMYVYRLDKIRGETTYSGSRTTVYSLIRGAPFPDIIDIVNVGDNASLSWRLDPNADSYIIQKQSIDEFKDSKTFAPIATQQITYMDSDVEIDKMYVYRLDKVRGGITYQGIETSVYSRLRETPFPDVIKVSNLGNNALLSWKHDANADSYIIQKQTIDKDDEIVDEQSIPCTQNTYIDEEIATDMMYVYRLDKLRGSAPAYEGLEITVYSKRREAPFPDTVEVAKIGDQARLTWRIDANADSYIIVRQAINKAGIPTTTIIDAGNELSYFDNAIAIDMVYIYRLDKKQGDTTYEGTKTITFSMARAEPFPDSVVIEVYQGGTMAMLKWTDDPNADSYSIEKQLIYDNGSYGALVTIPSTPTTQTSYLDANINVNYSYTYRLVKIQGGTPFKGTHLTMLEKGRPDPFPGVIITESLSNGKAAHLSWEPDIGADTYRVMRALNTMNASNQLEWFERNTSNGLQMLSDVSAIDTELIDDKSYVYRLDKYRNGAWIIGNQVTVFSWNRPPPFYETPTVESFSDDTKVHISWNADIGADIYRIDRRDDTPSNGWSGWKAIYNGTELSCEDNTANYDAGYQRYEYRLVKIRNENAYYTEYNTGTLAVTTRTAKDPHEPNDDYWNATLLDSNLGSNIYSFRFSDGRTLEDRDWYKVSIPAGKIANISIWYESGNDEMLQVYEPSKLEATVRDNYPFQIKNESTVQQFVYFAIIPDRTKFIDSGYPGGQLINYTIHWLSISNN
jgi:hypothetical protein